MTLPFQSAAPAELTLKVGGETFKGWIEAAVERGCDSLAHQCALRYIDQWSPEAEAWKINGGAECVLAWRDTDIINGFVDKPVWQVSGNKLSLQATFRSRTGDLVESSAVHDTGAWRDQTARQIVQDLVDPFNISVTVDGPDKKFPIFALREGETVFSAIDRICKVRALIPITTPGGDVRLFSSDTRSGKVRKFPVGDAHARSYVDDTTQRHSSYLTHATGITDAVDTITKGAATDTGVDRYRPLVVIGDAPAGTTEDLELLLAKTSIITRRSTLFTKLEFTRPEAYSQKPLSTKQASKLVRRTNRRRAKRGPL
jgi:prophage tail gpP-like protein